MSYRYMRTLLFFDLPTLTLEHKRSYRKFVKELIKIGFYRIQESVFVKLSLNKQGADSSIAYLNAIKPKEGNIFLITITEKQFSNMNILLGDVNSDVVSSDERIINL